MKALLLPLTLLAATSLPARAELPVLVYCSSIQGTQAHGTLTTADVEVIQNKTILRVSHCTGVLNWGCGNGMEDLLNVAIPVVSTDGKNFRGEQSSLLLGDQGEYDLSVPGLQHKFAPGECSPAI